MLSDFRAFIAKGNVLGLAVAVIGLVGQTYEFSRGQHAH